MGDISILLSCDIYSKAIKLLKAIMIRKLHRIISQCFSIQKKFIVNLETNINNVNQF